jgi:hypothetical protein
VALQRKPVPLARYLIFLIRKSLEASFRDLLHKKTGY